MLLKQIIRSLLIVFLLTIGLTGIGNTATLTGTQTLQVTSINAGNPYGLFAGSDVFVNYQIDTDQGYTDSGYSMHTFALNPFAPFNSSDSSFLFDLTFGTVHYLGSTDDRWNYFPAITFNTAVNPADWTVNTIDFYTIDDSRQHWISIGIGPQGGPIEVHAGPIPEPATLALFGMGLLSLAGISRKTRS